jgi:predicted ATPase
MSESPTVVVAAAADVVDHVDIAQNQDPIEYTSSSLLDTTTTSVNHKNNNDDENCLRPLRYDEQACEAHYDERDDADDDLEKGKIRFPQHVLFGRERESKQLNSLLEASIRQESLHIAFLEGMSGVGKSALVWESLLYGEGNKNHEDIVVDECNTKRNMSSNSSSTSRIRRRRSCWIASGKYNHHTTTQPFTAIIQSLELLSASIVVEAVAALAESNGKGMDTTFYNQPIVTVSQQFNSWYDSDDAATLISFCPSIASVQENLKKLYKRSRNGTRHRHRTNNYKQKESKRSSKPLVLQRRSTGDSSSQNNGDNNSFRDVSETSSIVSEDDSSSTSDQQNVLVASNDIQQLALALKAFLQCLTLPTRPLIWFLDDLQWADTCSIQLIQHLLRTSSLLASTDTISTNSMEEPAQVQFNQLPSHNDDEDETLETDLVTMFKDKNHHDSIIGLFVGAYRPISSSKVNDSRSQSSHNDEERVSHHSEQEDNHDEEKPLEHMLDSITKAVPSTLKMQVTNLTPKAVLDFCCTTLDMEEDEGWPLTNALYSATMGNIFHCRQALEHLVRSNCLYYDVMFFSWTYNLPEDGSVLQDVVEKSCQDVLVLVQSKLQACSELVRAILIRAAFTENTVFGAMLLLSLLQATGYQELTKDALREALDQATAEGVLLNVTWDSPSSGEAFGVGNHPFHSLRYKFSHDKVKEAACNLLPESGPERERVLLPLSTVLIQWALQASPSTAVSTDPQPTDGGLTSVPYTVAQPISPSANQEWMWFVGVQHLNSIPVQNILGTASASFHVSTTFTLPSIEINRKKLAQWNMRVAEMSIAHSSYKDAIKFLKSAISYLQPNEMWREDGPYYKLSLQLYNKLMEISLVQGEFEETKDAIAMVLSKAASLQDKITAFSTKVQLAVKVNDRNFEFGIRESLNVLTLFGIKFPSQPSAIEVGLEKMKFKMELQGRSVSVLGELELIPPKEHKADLMTLLSDLLHMSLLSNKHQYSTLSEIVALRGMRWTLENGISQHFALLLSQYSAPLRSKGELNTAGKYAAIVKRLFQRFSEESGSSIIRSKDFLFCEFIVSTKKGIGFLFCVFACSHIHGCL